MTSAATKQLATGMMPVVLLGTFTGTVKKVLFDVAPHPDDKDELALHEHAHQAHAVRGINA